MSFCSNLRRRPSCRTIISSITASDGLALRESSLQTHDISIPLPSDSHQTRALRLLLLTSSTVAPSTLSTTLARIQHFIALTGSSDIAIIFLLYTSAASSSPATNGGSSHPPPATPASAEGLNAYQHLSATLLAHPSISGVPILPVASPTSLTSLIRTYTTALTAPTSPITETSGHSGVNTVLDLLPWCTSTPPLRRETVFVLTDLFPSLRDLAGLARDGENAEEMVARFSGLVGEEVARGVVEFWREEWVAE